MNYGRIKKTDIANGPGVRVSLFVSGCRNHCKGCFQPETWDFNYGQEYDGVNTANEIIEALSPEYISGLSILGGDPIERENVSEVVTLCHLVKLLYPDKSIWLWTGYYYEELLLREPEILEYVDVIVDGPFKENLKDISLVWRGSSNQRIINVKESLEKGYAVEVEL